MSVGLESCAIRAEEKQALLTTRKSHLQTVPFESPLFTPKEPQNSCTYFGIFLSNSRIRIKMTETFAGGEISLSILLAT